MALFQGIKWNGRSYPLESHVFNHRQAIDDLNDCSNHITVAVPDPAQRVEYLIDSITCNDTALQAAIGLVRANTNNMRNDFEAAASALIEVDPYRKSQRSGAGNGRGAQIAANDFGAGRGSTGVDLRWHPKREFKNLSDEQKDELVKWMRTGEGKKHLQKSKDKSTNKRNREGGGNGGGNNSNKSDGNWKKKFKRAIKTPKGLAHIMSVMAAEEQNNTALIAAFQSIQAALPPAPPAVPPALPRASIASTNATQSVTTIMPATAMKLASILKKK